MLRKVEEEISYNPNHILGRGSFGTVVYEGIVEGINEPVAVKRLQRSNIKVASIPTFEWNFMHKVDTHPNILHYLKTEMNQDFYFIATQLCAGTLESLIERKYEGPPVGDEREVLLQITRGLAYLHSIDVVHRDIKPSNILIYLQSSSADGSIISSSVNPKIKLADYGISSLLLTDQRDVSENIMKVRYPIGTQGWMAPELFDFDSDSKFDIFSLGCIFGYTLTEGKKHPFGDSPLEQSIRIRDKEPMMQLKVEDLRGKYSQDVNQALFELIKCMVKMNPMERPNVHYILNHPFFCDNDDKASITMESTTSQVQKVNGDLSYDPKQIIETSSSSVVYSGLFGTNPVAVKRYLKTIGSDVLNIQKSKMLLNLIEKNDDEKYSHPNVMRYFFTLDDNNFMFSVSELWIGNLYDWVDGTYNGPDIEDESYILYQVTQGLSHLHDLGVVHGDIKPSNILIFSQMDAKIQTVIKLAGSEMSAMMSDLNRNGKNRIAHPVDEEWLAPELYPMLNSYFYPLMKSFDIDIYALGCIYLYTLSIGGKHPFGDVSYFKPKLETFPMRRIRNVSDYDLKKPYSNDTLVLQLIESMIEGDDSKRSSKEDTFYSMTREDSIKRPSVRNILESDFFESRHFMTKNICSNSPVSSALAMGIRKIDKNISTANFDSDPTSELLSICVKPPKTLSETDFTIQFIKLVDNDQLDINAKTSKGLNLLHILLKYQQKHEQLIELVQHLLQKGIDVNGKTREDWTPLHILLYSYPKNHKCLLYLVQLLIQMGADINAKTKYHECTPLHSYFLDVRGIEPEYINFKLVMLLVELGTDINAKTAVDETPLLQLLCSNYREDENIDNLIQLFVEKGADVNVKSLDGKTPLQLLCSNYREDENIDNLIQLFVEKGADVNVKSLDGKTPLHLLCANYSKNICNLVQLLIEKGANVNVKSSEEETPLHLLCKTDAVKQENVANMVQFLIAKGADVNVKSSEEETPLHFLCKNYTIKQKNIDDNLLVRLFIEKGADVNIKASKGKTPFHLLLADYKEYKNIPNLVQLFVEKGADINAKSSEGETVLLLLCKNYGKYENRESLVHLLIEKGADVNVKSSEGETPLHFLCRNYSIEHENTGQRAIRFLIEKGADVNMKSSNGDTSLHLLLADYRECKYISNLVELFITQKGIDINAKSSKGETPLLLLCKNYSHNSNVTSIIKRFIEKGTDVKVKSLDGNWTPLLYICANYRSDNLFDLVLVLLEAGADVNDITSDGSTPLHFLTSFDLAFHTNNHIDILKQLIKRGANVNAKTNEGWTPFLNLCENYRNDNLIEVILLFIDNGANINAKTSAGRTPLLNICEHYKHDNLVEIIQLLIDKGVDVSVKYHERTSLYYLCENYRHKNLIDLVRLLIDAGVHINASTYEGRTALHYLCENYENDNLIDIVRLLIEKGVNVNPIYYEFTPFLYLCRNYRQQNLIDLVSLFLEHNADVNSTAWNGRSPLHLICETYNHDNLGDVVRLLVHNGGDIRAKTKEGFTALSILERRADLDKQIFDQLLTILRN